jgi:hypothetical protein
MKEIFSLLLCGKISIQEAAKKLHWPVETVTVSLKSPLIKKAFERNNFCCSATATSAELKNG